MVFADGAVGAHIMRGRSSSSSSSPRRTSRTSSSTWSSPNATGRPCSCP